MNRPESTKRPAKQVSGTIGCLALCGYFLMSGIAAAWMLRNDGGPVWVAFLAGMAFAGGVLFVVIGMVPGNRKKLRGTLRVLLRSNLAIDRWAVKKACRWPLQTTTQGPFTLWTDCPNGVPIDWERECD